MKSTGRSFLSFTLMALLLLAGVSIPATNVRAACNGDVDVNGSVTVADALFTLRYVVNLIPHDAVNDAKYLASADVAPLDASQKPVGNQVVDISDALAILKRAVNLLSWEVTLPGQPGTPVNITLDASGTVQSTITAECPGGFQLTLNAGTLLALVGTDGDSQPPATTDDVRISLVNESDNLPTLPLGITPLARFRIVLAVNGTEHQAWFRSASGSSEQGAKLVIPITGQSINEGTLGILYSLASGSPVQVGTSAIGGAAPGIQTLHRTASIMPLADASGSDGMTFSPGGTGDHAAGGSAPPAGGGQAPQGAYWCEFTVPDPGPVDIGGGVVVNDPSMVNAVIIVEDSTKEILGDCVFGASDQATTSSADGSQFWCTRTGNSVKISSMQANLPKIHASRVSIINPNLKMWDIYNISANGGLHAGGAEYSDPYQHKEFEFAGFKKFKLISKNYTIAKKHAKEPLEQAGYGDLQSQFIRPVTEIDVHSTKDARLKIQDDVILKEHWKLVAGETRGNLGTYEWKDKYKGTAKAIATMPVLNYKVWEIDASDVTFEIDNALTNMGSNTVVYRTTAGTITQTQYTVPGNAGGCYGDPASFTDTYDIYPGDGYLSIFPGTDTVEYNAGASISLSTPVQDHPYKECCSWRTPACEDAVLEAGAQQHPWLETGEMNSRRTANPDETLQGSYATQPYSTPSYEWNLAPVYDNQ